MDRARPVFSFWRNQKEKMGGKRRSAACGGCSKPLSRMRHDWRPRQGPGIVPPRRCCNEPASILAGIPPPVRAGTNLPPSGKKQSLPIGEPHRSPAGKNPIPPRGARTPSPFEEKRIPLEEGTPFPFGKKEVPPLERNPLLLPRRKIFFYFAKSGFLSSRGFAIMAHSIKMRRPAAPLRES